METQQLDFFARTRLEREACQNAKPGDTFYRVQYGNVAVLAQAKPVTVERVTKTQIVLSNGDKLKRDSGNVVSAPQYSRVTYKAALPHVIAEVEEAVNDMHASQEFYKVEERIKALRVGSISRHNSVKLLELARALNAALDFSGLAE